MYTNTHKYWYINHSSQNLKEYDILETKYRENNIIPIVFQMKWLSLLIYRNNTNINKYVQILENIFHVFVIT